MICLMVYQRLSHKRIGDWGLGSLSDQLSVHMHTFCWFTHKFLMTLLLETICCCFSAATKVYSFEVLNDSFVTNDLYYLWTRQLNSHHFYHIFH